MQKSLSGLCAVLTISVALASTAPVDAAPIFAPQVQAAQPDVIQVRDSWRRHHGGRWQNHGWYNGHRGHRRHRPGLRYYNGFWFPGGAFIAGAIIGSALADSDPYYAERYYRRDYGERYYRDYSGGSHVDWCYARYRSYRAWDNTFQPYHGPRQQCYSPYD